jgi:hypothetical protein
MTFEYGRLTDRALEHLRARGCESILLAASELGRPIYDRLGFVASAGYCTYSGAVRTAPAPVPMHNEITINELAGVYQLDSCASGEDRRAALEALAQPGCAWTIGAATEVRGFAVRTPWGLGPVVAFDPADGQHLLEVLLRQAQDPSHVSVTVPVENPVARAYLERAGFKQQTYLPRMVLGPPIAWRPEAIWAIFNFAMG